jgi:hypothetical protein
MKLVKMHIVFVEILLKCNFNQKQQSIFLGSLVPFKQAFIASNLSDHSDISEATKNVMLFKALKINSKQGFYSASYGAL